MFSYLTVVIGMLFCLSQNSAYSPAVNKLLLRQSLQKLKDQHVEIPQTLLDEHFTILRKGASSCQKPKPKNGQTLEALTVEGIFSEMNRLSSRTLSDKQLAFSLGQIACMAYTIKDPFGLIDEDNKETIAFQAAYYAELESWILELNLELPHSLRLDLDQEALYKMVKDSLSRQAGVQKSFASLRGEAGLKELSRSQLQEAVVLASSLMQISLQSRALNRTDQRYLQGLMIWFCGLSLLGLHLYLQGYFRDRFND